MNRFLFLILLFSFTLFSCGKRYVVEGSSYEPVMDGSKVYLKTFCDHSWIAIDSCEIIHGHFEMKGKRDSVVLATLFFDEESILPVVLERGRIHITIERERVRVEGTPLNDALSSFICRKELIENHLVELEHLENQLILEGHTAQAEVSAIRDSLSLTAEKINLLMENFITQHFNTVLAPCVFRLLCSTLPYPYMTGQIERLLNEAPSSFKQDPFVKEFADAASENVRRLNRHEN